MRGRSWLVLTALAACAPPTAEPVARRDDAVAGWTAASGSLGAARGLFTTELRAIAVTGGQIAIVGGVGPALRAELDLFDGATFVAGTSMGTARSMMGLVSLADGGILAAGGGQKTGPTTNTAFTSAERWRPATRTWTTAGTLNTARFSPSATRLADGRVLIAGGQAANAVTLNSAEIYDPDDDIFTPVADTMLSPRVGQVAARLPDGKVIQIGGGDDAPPGPRKIDRFDPGTGLFSDGPDMVAMTRIAHVGARLPDGRILYCGACGPGCTGASVDTCEIFNPANNSVASADSLNAGRAAASMILLPTGKVLIAGGLSNDAALSSAELYDPVANSWTTTASMTNARYDAGMALLDDGRAVIAGGRQGSTSSSTYLSSGEIFDPGTPTSCEVCQIDGTCVRLREDLACDDGDASTTGDRCTAGVCEGTGGGTGDDDDDAADDDDDGDDDGPSGHKDEGGCRVGAAARHDLLTIALALAGFAIARPRRRGLARSERGR